MPLEKSKYQKISHAILSAVSLAGTISVIALAPNVLSVLGETANSVRINRTNASLSRLVKNGFVFFRTTKGGKRFLVLTEKGRSQLHKLELQTTSIKKPHSWDGKWRVVVFDIPEKKRRLRDSIRNTFNRVGFKRLQDSVWIYPYDCEDFITLLKADLFMGKDLLYMIVEKVENDKHLRVSFGL